MAAACKIVLNQESYPLSDNSSAQSLYHTATRAALLGLVVNLALGIVKLVGGIVGSSFALIEGTTRERHSCAPP